MKPLATSTVAPCSVIGIAMRWTGADISSTFFVMGAILRSMQQLKSTVNITQIHKNTNSKGKFTFLGRTQPLLSLHFITWSGSPSLFTPYHRRGLSILHSVFLYLFIYLFIYLLMNAAFSVLLFSSKINIQTNI